MTVLRTAYVNVLPKTDRFDPELKRRLRSIDMRSEGARVSATFSKGFGGGLRTSLSTSLRAATGGLGGVLSGALGIGAAVAQIGKIGMAYEDNLNIFQSVTKATGAQMDQVAAKARQLGADVTLPGVSAAGAAEAMTELSKSGLSVQQSMDAATGTLRLARAAGLGEAQAAEIAANAVNAFGLQAKDVTFVADELAAAANSSSVEVTDVADAFKMAAAVFSSFQGPAVGSKEAITELNTAVAILGNNGIKGSDAGTSLKQMMLQLTGPTQAAKDQMRLLAERAGGATISLEQQDAVLHGSKAVREAAIAQIAKQNAGMQNMGDIAFDASGKMRPLPQIIDLVTRGTKGMTDEERNFAITQIFGADASRSVIALMKGGLPTYEAQRKAVLAQGAAADVAAAKNKGLRGAIDNVQSQLENAAISIYTAVKGPLTTGLNGVAAALAPLAGQIAKFAGFVARNIGTIRDWAVAIGLVTAALKVNAAFMAVQAAGGVVAWLRTLGPIVTVTRAWAGAQALLNAALIANPIGIVIVALAALVAGLVLAYRHSDTFRKIVDTAFRGIAAAAKWAWETVIRPALTALTAYWRNVIAPAAMWLWRNVMQPVWGGISRVITAAWIVIQIAFKAWTAYLRNVLFPVIRFLFNNVIRPVFTNAYNAIRLAWNLIRPVLAALGGFITKNVAPAFRTGVAAITSAWDRVREAARRPVAFVVNRVINPLIGGFNRVAGAFGVKDRVAPIAGFARGGQIPGTPSLKDNLLAAGPAGPLAVASGEFITNTKSTLANLPLLQAINRKRGRVTRADIDPVLDGMASGGMVGDGIGDFFGKIWNSVKGVASTVTNAVMHPLETIRKVAGSLLGQVPGGGAFVSVIKGVGRKLIDGVGNWLKNNAGAGLGTAGVNGGWRTMQRLIAARFPGLHMISGFRPGARTLTGNTSYHALGRAVDYPPVRALAAWIKSTYGARTKELITPWQELNLHNGRPHHYTGAVWNQHNFAGGNAHVHWAARNGGLVGRGSGIPIFDSGGTLAPGFNTVYNATGRPERVAPVAGDTYVFNFAHPVEGERQLRTLVVKAVKDAKRRNELP